MNKQVKHGAKTLLVSLLAAWMLISCGTEQPAGENPDTSVTDTTAPVTTPNVVLKPTGEIDADADTVAGIAIRNAEELMKIGRDNAYPMDGDYTLVADIDLTEVENFTPIGGSESECGIVEGKNVFTGTFDGRNHTIVGLSIDVSTTARVHVGLFGSVGSPDKNDPAVVKNLIIKDVSITGSARGSATYAALCGQTNGYAEIDNIALLSGKVDITHGGGDILGIGSLIGQCRTQSWTGLTNKGIKISNIFTNLTVEGENNGNNNYTGGVIGRIRGSDISRFSNIVQIGSVTHEGDKGHALFGGDSGVMKSVNVYFLAGVGQNYSSTGTALHYGAFTDGTLTLASDMWHVEPGTFPLLNGTYNSPLFSILDFVSVSLAEGETMSTVESGFSLVDNAMGKAITWTSGNEEVIRIEGNKARVIKPDFGFTDVVLTASSGGVSKNFSLRVISGVVGEIVPDRVNNVLLTKNYPSNSTYNWVVTNAATGKTVKTASTTDGKLPLTENMNNCIITLKVDGYDPVIYYNSSIPTISITSDTEYYSVDKNEYSEANLTVYTTAEYAKTKYNGGTLIKIRGNSTAYQPKRPFRLKLDKKTDLFGMGESKHWVLLANFYDRTNLRNKLSYDLGMELGLAGCESILVNLIYNGEYYGLYQLSENIRIDEGRVDIYNWEETAEAVAKAIANKEGLTMAERDALEEKLTTNLSWITSGKFGNYNIADYYDTSTFDITGGYLIENDYYYDEYTKFTTDNEMKLMVQNPEYLKTNTEMMDYLKNYIQNMEDALYSPNRLSDEGKHYSEYLDMDSFLDFFMVNQVFKNVELFYKSCYMYKDVGGLLTFGPIWDMDWATGNHTNLGYDSPERWKHDHSQDREYWYKAIYNDPWFMIQLCERWVEIQDNLDKMMKQLEIQSQAVEEAAKLDNERWGYDWSVKKEISTLKYWLLDRIAWMDKQMKDPETLIRSLDYYKDSSLIGITGFYEGKDFVELTITVKDPAKHKTGELLINGRVYDEVALTDGCKIRIPMSEFRESGKYNSIEILAKKADGKYTTVQKRRAHTGSTMVDADFFYYLSK